MARKEFYACMRCGADMKSEKNPDGWEIKNIRDCEFIMAMCPCGMRSPLFRMKHQLQEWWNHRPGRPYTYQKIKVRHEQNEISGVVV